MSTLQIDALAANGASNFIHKKIHKLLDKFEVDVCSSCHKLCGLEMTGEKAARVPALLCCKGIACNVDLPYATKVIFQLLMGMGIFLTLNW